MTGVQTCALPIYKDSLPAGYSWYPLEWDFMYDAEEIPAMKSTLMAEKFFTKGIVTIYGPGYEEGNIVNGNVENVDQDNAVEQIIAGKRVVGTTIYTLEGKEVNYPVKGINIIKYRYDDGSVETKKIIRVED